MDWSAHQLSSGMSEFRGALLTFRVPLGDCPPSNLFKAGGFVVCSTGACRGSCAVCAWPGPGRQVCPCFPKSLIGPVTARLLVVHCLSVQPVWAVLILTAGGEVSGQAKAVNSSARKSES